MVCPPGRVDGRGRRFAARDLHGPGALPEPDRTALRRAARHRTRFHGHGRRPPQHPQSDRRSLAASGLDGRAIRCHGRPADRADASGTRRQGRGGLPLAAPRGTRPRPRTGRARPRRQGQRNLQQPRYRSGRPQDVRRRNARSEGDTCWPPRRRISSGPATNTPPPARDSSSTPIPTKIRSRSRPRP